MSRGDLPAWLLTYAVHSTLLIGAVWLLVRRGVLTSHHLQDTFWKAALVGGLLTARLTRPGGRALADARRDWRC